MPAPLFCPPCSWPLWPWPKNRRLSPRITPHAPLHSRTPRKRWLPSNRTASSRKTSRRNSASRKFRKTADTRYRLVSLDNFSALPPGVSCLKAADNSGFFLPCRTDCFIRFTQNKKHPNRQ
ncbi:hypothetical protein EMIT0373P_30885 [Pseudomonas chlororaphis]